VEVRGLRGSRSSTVSPLRPGGGIVTTRIGARIRALREAAGLSQTALAGTDVSASYLSLIESGRRTASPAVLERLAERLDVSPDYLVTGEEPPQRLQLRSRLAFLRYAIDTGDRVAARTEADALALQDVRQQADLVDECTLERARAYELVGDLPAACRLLEPLAAKSREGRASVPVPAVHMLLATVYLDAGDVHRAVEITELGLAAARADGTMGDPALARLAATLVWAYLERGDALYAGLRADELLREIEATTPHPASLGSILWNAALALQARGEHGAALATMDRAIALLGEGHDGRDLVRSRVAKAYLLLQLPEPRPDEAVELLRDARARLEAQGALVDLAACEVMLGRALLLSGDPDAACRVCEAALRTLGAEPRIESVDARTILAGALSVMGRRDEAVTFLDAAVTDLGQLAGGRRTTRAWAAVAQQYARLEEPERATDAALQALHAGGLAERGTERTAYHARR